MRIFWLVGSEQDWLGFVLLEMKWNGVFLAVSWQLVSLAKVKFASALKVVARPEDHHLVTAEMELVNLLKSQSAEAQNVMVSGAD